MNFLSAFIIGMEKSHDFDVKEMTVKLCNTNLNPEFKDYSPAVRRLCAQIIESERHIDIFSRHFSGDSPTSASVYIRKGLICGELQAECKVLPSDLATKPKECESCRLAVRDTFAVLRRSSGRSDYASKAHVW